MLWFERQVVATLVSDLDPSSQVEVESFVDSALRAMPEHIRLGVAGESIALGAWTKVRDLITRNHDGAAGARLGPLETSRLAPVRQYVRLLRSLVLFAQHERVTEAA
jgi:hypothetical protein